jgi:hypothetical protein
MSWRFDTFTARCVTVLLLAWISSRPDAHAATSADDVVAELTTLTKGHVYRGSRYAERVVYDKETIVKVEFERSKGWLGVTVDDAEEKAPVTVIVPLRETRVGSPNEGSISLSCTSPCIKTTRDTFATAVQKLSTLRGAELKLVQHRNSIHFGCHAERCGAMRRALLKLVELSKRG